MAWPDVINDALTRSSGARFYLCALQVNPYEYLARHGKGDGYSDEAAYNEAIVEACLAKGVEVIGLTDHHRASSSEKLASATREAGLHALPGFEVESSEGVHLLCLFDEEVSSQTLDRYVAALGIHDPEKVKLSSQSVREICRKVEEWDGVTIASHALDGKGLLGALKGQARAHTWTEPSLLAAAIPGAVDDVDQQHRDILRNVNLEHRRDHPVAVINADDVCSPADLEKPGATSWIKMSNVSASGLRQAFLDPVSRIRLNSDAEPESHTQLLAIGWQGGFLDGLGLHLNENLNVLVGGRGTGKSTVIESIRYALGIEPLGEEAQAHHQEVTRRVLGSGTKVSVLLETQRPKHALHLVERTVPNPPVVRDSSGSTVPILPLDLARGTEIYGQHEISELVNDPERLTRVLDRFVEPDDKLSARKQALYNELESSRKRLLDLASRRTQTEDRLEALPGLEATIGLYEDAGLEERLRERSLLVREERILKTAQERVGSLQELLEALGDELPIDRTFVSDAALADLPNNDVLKRIDQLFKRASEQLSELAGQFIEVVASWQEELRAVQSEWDERRRVAEERYESILRDLQRDRIDGEEFIRLRQRIEELRPLRDRLAALEADQAGEIKRRRNLLAEWEDVLSEEFRRLDRAAKTVSRQLEGRLRVQVFAGANRTPLTTLLEKHLSGRRAELLRALEMHPDLSVLNLARTCREGPKALQREFGLTERQAEQLADAEEELFFRIEELELPPATEIELNVAPEGEAAVWQPLNALSTGQKATALLLLLLLGSDSPLLIDQPEDDLDNRFIVDRVVNRMREEKRRRQFVFATHNANIPVLGDAELIIGLTTTGDPNRVQGTVRDEHLGSIDESSVRRLVEDVLEGGREAFQLRRLKYGY